MKFKIAIALAIAFGAIALLQGVVGQSMDQKILYAAVAAVVGLALPYVFSTVFRFLGS